MYVSSTAATSTDRTSSTRTLCVKAERFIVHQNFTALDCGDNRCEIGSIRLIGICAAIRRHDGHCAVDVMALRQNSQQPVECRRKGRIHGESLAEPRLRARIVL